MQSPAHPPADPGATSVIPTNAYAYNYFFNAVLARASPTNARTLAVVAFEGTSADRTKLVDERFGAAGSSVTWTWTQYTRDAQTWQYGVSGDLALNQPYRIYTTDDTPFSLTVRHHALCVTCAVTQAQH